VIRYDTIRYDTIEEFNVDSKALSDGDDMFSRFDTILECDRRTDRQTVWLEPITK